jgi:transcription antitermination factor NusG
MPLDGWQKIEKIVFFENLTRYLYANYITSKWIMSRRSLNSILQLKDTVGFIYKGAYKCHT